MTSFPKQGIDGDTRARDGAFLHALKAEMLVKADVFNRDRVCIAVDFLHVCLLEEGTDEFSGKPFSLGGGQHA